MTAELSEDDRAYVDPSHLDPDLDDVDDDLAE